MGMGHNLWYGPRYGRSNNALRYKSALLLETTIIFNGADLRYGVCDVKNLTVKATEHISYNTTFISTLHGENRQFLYIKSRNMYTNNIILKYMHVLYCLYIAIAIVGYF